MKRHKNRCLLITADSAPHDIMTEMYKGETNFGAYNSMHEAYAVIKEELDEFWEGVKNNDPDPIELLQVAATAQRAMIELCARAREEIDGMKGR